MRATVNGEAMDLPEGLSVEDHLHLPRRDHEELVARLFLADDDRARLDGLLPDAPCEIGERLVGELGEDRHFSEKLDRIHVGEYTTPAMRATVNGEQLDLPDGLTVAALLTHLGVKGDRVAVERNGEVVKKARHAEQPVQPGDVLEIVTFVGGG